ncbi:MAG: substrate-binding domain-containing protein [Deltaproteobacteria bacterium]|nr:substrate-binding domain-containing protein [Deltaproteobacteria bacterium]MBI3388525.1 substrate-binding domain-containing protein [Deltaproteobacteria bacterium]
MVTRRILSGLSISAALSVLLSVTAASAQEHVRLSTTTSTENSGLLAAILPTFEQRFHLKVDVIAVGSGKALKLAENGDVDVVLSHAPELEDAFVKAGFGVNRREVMYNDFIIVGPPSDPAKLRGSSGAVDAFKQIAAAQATFISRGDESGTHQKEKDLWKAVGIIPSGAWYVSAGQGMGEVLLMANERQAYTLADRGTYIAFKQKQDLTITNEGDPALFNPYTISAVNPAKQPHARYIEAMELIAWITAPDGQRAIAGFTMDGQVLFHPTAVPPGAAP